MIVVIIYSKANCPYCERAKTLLQQAGIAYQERRVDTHQAYAEEMRAKVPSARTLPQIFIHDQAIGGFDDLYRLWQTKALAALLNPS